MKAITLNRKSNTALHASLVLILLAALMLLLSAHAFAASSPQASGQINASGGAYLRKSSSTGSRKVALLADNTNLTIYREVYKNKKSTAKKKVWYYVSANGKKGYVRSDLVDNVNYTMLSGTVKSKAAYRKGPGTKMTKRGTLKKGAKVVVYLDARPVASTKGSSKVWYKIYHDGKFSYVCSKHIKITGKTQTAAVSTQTASNVQPTQAQVDQVVKATNNSINTLSNASFENFMTSQGFPESYKAGLRALHQKHPNWVFTSYRTNINWIDAMKKETVYGVSLVSSSYPASYRSTSKNSFSSYAMNAAAGGVVTEEEPAAAAQNDPMPEASSADAVNNTATGEVEEKPEKTAVEVVKTETVMAAASFEDVQKAVEESANAAEGSEEGSAAEPVTGTVITDSASVYTEADPESAVITEISKDAAVTVKAAKVTEQSSGSDAVPVQPGQWYEVEFESVQTVAGSEGDENAQAAYVDSDQNEDKELEAANSAAEKEIIGNDADDDSDAESDAAAADINAESAEGNEESGSEAGTPSEQTETAEVILIKGYVKAADIQVMAAKEQQVTVAEAAADEGQTQTETASENEALAGSESETQTEISEPAETPQTTGPAEEAGLSQIVSNDAKGAYYQVERGWYNASANVVAYYMDPRNFLNEDRIFMFEDLSYKSEYQTASVVNKIISGTKLPSYGFTTNVFMNAGAKYNISPVFLAARVRQETGGSSASVNGSKSGGTVVYNPFNIGASGSNPVANGLAYAKKMGWTTPVKAVEGGASYLASGYISKKQNSIYFQRFNVANGLSNVGTHQYMTNTMAPYSEAYITKSSYSQLGITNEALGFVIPIYNNMPAKTKLP